VVALAADRRTLLTILMWQCVTLGVADHVRPSLHCLRHMWYERKSVGLAVDRLYLALVIIVRHRLFISSYLFLPTTWVVQAQQSARSVCLLVCPFLYETVWNVRQEYSRKLSGEIRFYFAKNSIGQKENVWGGIY